MSPSPHASGTRTATGSRSRSRARSPRTSATRSRTARSRTSNAASSSARCGPARSSQRASGCSSRAAGSRSTSRPSRISASRPTRRGCGCSGSARSSTPCSPTGALVCAIFLLLDHSHAQRAVTLSWTIGVPVGTALAVVAVRYRKWICRGRLTRILGPPLDAIAVVGQIVASPRRHGVAAFTGMAVYWAGEVFVLWVCLAAFTGTTPSVRGGRRRLRNRLRADAADAPARGRGRRRGAAAVRARLGRLRPGAGRPRRLRLPRLQPLAAARAGGLRALPPAAASAGEPGPSGAGRRSRS